MSNLPTKKLLEEGIIKIDEEGLTEIEIQSQTLEYFKSRMNLDLMVKNSGQDEDGRYTCYLGRNFDEMSIAYVAANGSGDTPHNAINDAIRKFMEVFNRVDFDKLKEK